MFGIFSRINSNKQSVEAEEGTPNLNQILHDRQNFLEEKLEVRRYIIPISNNDGTQDLENCRSRYKNIFNSVADIISKMQLER